VLSAGGSTTKRGALLLLASVVAFVTLVWALGYDLDRDGWPDSLVLGRSAVHLFLTIEGRPVPPSRHREYGRLYDVPPDYVHVIVKRAFESEPRWTLVSSDDRLRTAEVSRRADGARAAVRVDEWRGRSVVRVVAAEPAGASASDVVAEAFHAVESLLFHGISTPRTVRDFAPPA